MKVRDLIDSLSNYEPDDDIVLKHLYTNPEVVMTTLRVYKWHGRVVVDGYNQEKNNEN